MLLGILLVVLFSCEREIEQAVPRQDVDFVASEIGDIIPGEYIVVLNTDPRGLKSTQPDYAVRQDMVNQQAYSLFVKASIAPNQPMHTYAAAIYGFSVKMEEKDAEAIRQMPEVKGVWPNRVVTLKKPGTLPSDPPKEEIPYGIVRVGYTTYTGTHKAWIIDTGIDLDHPDLNVNATLSKAFGLRTTSADDDNGHGSHCAGIVAAIDNEIGVVGVAAGAMLVAVKVLDRRGSGSTSGVIAGVDYVAATAFAGDVANMSLGGGVYEPLDLAVVALGEKGVFVALAAGNESDNADNHSPARANGLNLYTVSAMDANDNWAYFSNYGNPPVDYCAPGVSVKSTYKGGGYATMSGTSMAAPHVCGVLLLTGGKPATDGNVIGDPDGNPDPIAHK